MPVERFTSERHDIERLDLALLHAAPLVWRQTTATGVTSVSPLDSASLSLDFKTEVKALWDLLARTQKHVGVRFDVASSATLGELLGLKPAMLHLVCHADFDQDKLSRGEGEAGAFFLPEPSLNLP
jgi:hypothetical protein